MRLKTFAFLAGTVTLAGSILIGAMNPQFALSSAVRSVISSDSDHRGSPSATPPPMRPVTDPGSYGDGQSSLQHLIDASSLIVSGTVIAQAIRQDGRAVISTVEVRNRLKGASPFHIRVIQNGQFGDAGLLQSGEKYILSMNPQPDATPDTYYIVGGGIQGLFLQSGGTLKNEDPAMDADLQAMSDLSQLSRADALEALIAGRLHQPNATVPKRVSV
ncbi:hypothetical protein [Cohnella nanjingensis]|uniref:Uncharacterized protein n=1 Tax=Cohnella nanjingensis TaxID=1387779 RepID=A0A7X0RLN7_9BACL|nr:hypothetical protein [Cohnella nanjingensis]MBB6669824.1 hypothetical protein [Cohnella nanjingensis]